MTNREKTVITASQYQGIRMAMSVCWIVGLVIAFLSIRHVLQDSTAIQMLAAGFAVLGLKFVDKGLSQFVDAKFEYRHPKRPEWERAARGYDFVVSSLVNLSIVFFIAVGLALLVLQRNPSAVG